MRTAILVTTIIALATGSAFADTLTYRNSRFGTSVTFPAGIFNETMPAPANGDGMTVVADDGASIAVYGSANGHGATLKDLVDMAAQDHGRSDFEVTYRRVASDWAVISGFDGPDIFYHRIEMGRSKSIHGLLIRFPAGAKSRYEPLIKPIADSLEGP